MKGKKKLKKIFFKKGGQSIVQNCIYITVHVIFFLPCTAFFSSVLLFLFFHFVCLPCCVSDVSVMCYNSSRDVLTKVKAKRMTGPIFWKKKKKKETLLFFLSISSFIVVVGYFLAEPSESGHQQLSSRSRPTDWDERNVPPLVVVYYVARAPSQEIIRSCPCLSTICRALYIQMHKRREHWTIYRPAYR